MRDTPFDRTRGASDKTPIADRGDLLEIGFHSARRPKSRAPVSSTPKMCISMIWSDLRVVGLLCP